MSAAERTLAAILRIFGIVTLTAVFAIIMPTSCMETTNRWLGLGELPDTPIVGYLTRSLSAMYALQGALLLYLSFDVRRYAALLRFVAVLGLTFSIVMFFIDLAVRMPWWWTWGEGPPLIPLFVVIFWLATLVERKRKGSSAVDAT
jgi:hypothetical protein